MAVYLLSQVDRLCNKQNKMKQIFQRAQTFKRLETPGAYYRGSYLILRDKRRDKICAGNEWVSTNFRCRPPARHQVTVFPTTILISWSAYLLYYSSYTPIPVSKLDKDLVVQKDNMLSSSAKCTEAANKARRLIFMIGRSFQDLSKSAFIPLNEALVRPHLEYGMPACSANLVADMNHLHLIQRLATRLVTGMRHLPYEE